MEKALVKAFDRAPQNTDLETINAWYLIDSFPIMDYIRNGTITVNANRVEESTTSYKATVYYHGQVDSNGKENGVGRLEWSSGDMYEGEIQDKNAHGFGRYIWSNGSYYIGNFEKNLMNGKGMYRYASGKIQEGVFKNNIF